MHRPDSSPCTQEQALCLGKLPVAGTCQLPLAWPSRTSWLTAARMSSSCCAHQRMKNACGMQHSGAGLQLNGKQAGRVPYRLQHCRQRGMHVACLRRSPWQARPPHAPSRHTQTCGAGWPAAPAPPCPGCTGRRPPAARKGMTTVYNTGGRNCTADLARKQRGRCCQPTAGRMLHCQPIPCVHLDCVVGAVIVPASTRVEHAVKLHVECLRRPRRWYEAASSRRPGLTGRLS